MPSTAATWFSSATASDSTRVLGSAVSIVPKGVAVPLPPGSYYCEVCLCHVSGDHNWLLHINSDRHKRKAAINDPTLPQDPQSQLMRANPDNFFECKACGVVISGHTNVQQHVKGTKHIKNTARFNAMTARAMGVGGAAV